MFTVWLGTRPAVVLCRYAALRDALVLQADAFSGRGATAIFERFTRGNGIAFSEGPRWPTLRHFALGALKEFGLGTRSVEECVLEEAACLLGEFQATGDTASILLRFFLLPVGSHSDTDLTPQCTGPGNVPPAFQLRLVAH